jgi:outer membrane protein assembly factor BamB
MLYRMRAVLWNLVGVGFLWTLPFMTATMLTSLYAEGPAMTTVRYNNGRTGWNPAETVLTVETVNPKTFGQQWATKLDGQIYGAPLYVSGVVIGGRAYDVVYVATENNYIYALNAESGEPLWPRPYNLGTPGLQSLVLDGCGSIYPNIGITSTPVIDLATRTLYAVGLTRQDRLQVFKMAAVDIATGQSRPGWPVIVDPPSDVPLDTRVTSQRGALLLANGRVYVPFGAYSGDCGVYHGWVVAVDTASPTARQRYYHTPRVGAQYGGGIWASSGIAADADGFLYAATGNSFNALDVDYSNAVLRLNPDLAFSGRPSDFFMPSNWSQLNTNDLDLGASAPMLLPRQPRSSTRDMIFIAGKAGVGHLLNRENLGGVARGDGVIGEGVYSRRILDEVASTAAYYQDLSFGPMIFVAGNGDGSGSDCVGDSGVMALSLYTDGNGSSFYLPLWCAPGMESALSPVVTSAPGRTGILWAVDGVGGVLYAFNAFSGEELYNSSMVPGDDLGSILSFVHFTVIDGRVFIGNDENDLVAYGRR